MNKEILFPYFKKYWDEANRDEDEMWLDNLRILGEQMGMVP